jgi:hypothetical protein
MNTFNRRRRISIAEKASYQAATSRMHAILNISRRVGIVMAIFLFELRCDANRWSVRIRQFWFGMVRLPIIGA